MDFISYFIVVVSSLSVSDALVLVCNVMCSTLMDAPAIHRTCS